MSEVTITEVKTSTVEDRAAVPHPTAVPVPSTAPAWTISEKFVPVLATYTMQTVASTYDEILADGVTDKTRLPFDDGCEQYELLPRGTIYNMRLAGKNMDAAAKDRIRRHNMIQKTFESMEEFDASVVELQMPTPLPLRVNTYMNLAEACEDLSGETRKIIVLSHFAHMPDQDKPSLDLVSSMIEWDIAAKSRTVEQEYNTSKQGCFGCGRTADKRTKTYRKRVNKEDSEHARAKSKRKFPLEAPVADT
jgi:hypothetical protein